MPNGHSVFLQTGSCKGLSTTRTWPIRLQGFLFRRPPSCQTLSSVQRSQLAALFGKKIQFKLLMLDQVLFSVMLLSLTGS